MTGRGEAGVAAGYGRTPEEGVKVKEHYTGQYLKLVLARKGKVMGKKQAAK